MSSEDDDDADAACGGVDETLTALVAMARQSSPTAREARGESPASFFNRRMNIYLDNGDLPALNLLFQGVSATFNYYGSVKTLVPMAFGLINSVHLQDDSLERSTRELGAVVCALIQARALSPLSERRNHIEVRKSLGEALRDYGVIFKMLAGEQDVSGLRFGEYLEQADLEQLYEALQDSHR